jgi:hypothetical protein
VAGSRGTSRKKSGIHTPADALRWIEEQGVVLATASGAVPSLGATIAGEPIRGSWWSHPMAQQIFAITEAVSDSKDVARLRLVDGKITYVHRRVWPALARLADRFDRKSLAWVISEHTPSGKHVNVEKPFEKWMPADAIRAGRKLSEEEAERLLGLERRSVPQKRRR